MRLVSLVIGLNTRAFLTLQQVEILVSPVTKRVGIWGIHLLSFPKSHALAV